MSEWQVTEIGNIPIDWKLLPIGEIGNVTKLAGYEYTKYITYVEDGEIIALRALNVRDGKLDLSDVKQIYREISDGLERSKLIKNDILFTYVGANIGQFALVPENNKFHLAPNICRIRCSDVCVPYFLFSYFRSVYFKDSLDGFSHGSSQPTMPMGSIRQIPIPVPPLSEQKSIAEILCSLDGKIDLLLRQNQTLEQMADTLFRQWFLENPNPEWEEKSLSSIATFLNGLACQKYPPENKVDKLPVLKIKDLKGGITENSDWASTNINPEYIVKNGDIIFAWSASLMVKIWDGQDCILNQHLFKVTSEDYPKWFYYLWSKHHLDEFISIAASHATTMGHIKRADLDETMVLIPRDEELKAFTGIIEPIINKIIINNRQSTKLVDMRDTLLPKLMSGEIRLETNE